MKHVTYMQRALELAEKGRGRTSPNPMVGCVIVKSDKVIGEGWHKRCGGPHAEVEALKMAGSKAKGATLYVTLEPCFHQGKTPPCIDAILEAGIKEVVVAVKDYNPLVAGKSLRKLKTKGVKVTSDCLAAEAFDLNEAFFKYITQKQPFVVAKTAQTLDGKIATANGHSQWITSAKTRQVAHQLRNEFDAIMVGINTVLSDNPRLNAQRKSKKLKKIIVDSRLRVPERGKLYVGTDPQNIIIATTSKANKAKCKRLEAKGCQVLVSPGSSGQVNLKWLMKQLAKQDVVNVLIEGGGTLIGGALKAGVVDKMWMFIAPKVLGDGKARNAIDGLNATNINQALELQDLNLYKINSELLVEGYVYRNR